MDQLQPREESECVKLGDWGKLLSCLSFTELKNNDFPNLGTSFFAI